MPEYFETFDANGTLLGLVPRSQVHAQGLWHKSAHVFLFTPNEELYLQCRSHDKDLYANLWDYSVGEHLTPGETYHAAAQRGLQEELGVSGVDLTALGDARPSSFVVANQGIADQEFQQAYRGTYAGNVHPDPTEVAEVRTIGLAELARWIEQAPEQFTPSFVRDIVGLGFLTLGMVHHDD